MFGWDANKYKELAIFREPLFFSKGRVNPKGRPVGPVRGHGLHHISNTKNEGFKENIFA